MTSVFLLYSNFVFVHLLLTGNPQYGGALRLIYENTAFLCIVIALPCFAAQFGIMYRVPSKLTMCLIALAIVVTAWHYVIRICSGVKSNGGEARWAKSKRVSFVVIASLLFIVVLSYQKRNYYGVAAALAYFHNFFVTGPTGTAFNHPAIDLFLYQLAFFNVFAVKALLD